MNTKNINFNQQIVGEDDINRANSTVLDFNEDDSRVNLPDAEKLLDEVIQILEYMSSEDMLKLKEKNQLVFEEELEQKFPDFADKYYSVFKMICSGADLDPLFEMLKAIDNVNKGKQTLQKAEKNVGRYLGKFLPDNLKENLEQNLKD